MVHKNLPVLAFVFVLTAVALLAMSPKAMAETITTSIDYSYWPTYSVVGQTQDIVIQITPAPNYGYDIYSNCTLFITDPNGNTIAIIINSTSSGYARFNYRPTFEGSYYLQFYLPEQNMYSGEFIDTYTSIVSTDHIWIVTSPLSVSVSPSTQNATIGQSKTFTASVSGGIPTYHYQWFEGTTIVGTSAQLTISKGTAGTYSLYCRVMIPQHQL